MECGMRYASWSEECGVWSEICFGFGGGVVRWRDGARYASSTSGLIKNTVYEYHIS
ncbi:MAG: hypothetical protein IK148_09245 [Prevotella sp.]|nr:hypothetical protein [Prevotella sp.]